MISSNQKIEKKLRIRLFATLVLWAVVGFIVFMLFGTVKDESNNPVIVWLGSRLDLLYIMFLIIGFFSIFYFYWKKPWDYLNEVIDATETVYEKSAKGITLSAPLHDVESRMKTL